jgi:hypothetical protein
MVISAALAIFSGLMSLLGIANPRRHVAAASCPGGALVGASRDVAQSGTAPVHPGTEPLPAGR